MPFRVLLTSLLLLRLLTRSAEAVLLEQYSDEAGFLARLGGATCIDFDDVETDSGVTRLDADRYLAATGASITGHDGQYVGTATGFVFADDFPPVSPPNMLAPGPTAPLDAPDGSGGNSTGVRFFAEASRKSPGVVAGFGLWFIDADFPGIGPSFFAIYAASGALLGSTPIVSGANASQTFAGIVAVDEVSGDPIPTIRRVVIQNGNGGPVVFANEAVTLDDFCFDAPALAPEPSVLLCTGAAGLVLAAVRHRRSARARRA